MSKPARPAKPSVASPPSPQSRERLKKAIAKARARNAHRRPQDIEAAINQALDEVRAERFGSARKTKR